MAAKLKNLKVKKVDFVDEGANPDADIKLFKRKEKEKQSAGEGSGKGSGVWKRLLAFIGKAAGMDQDEIDSAMEEIQKGDSMSFNEKFNEAKNRKIADEVWEMCYALQSSLCSILNDEELDSTKSATAMQESLNEFCTVVQECIGQWSDGKESGIVRKSEEVSEADLEIMKSAVERLNESIEKAAAIPAEAEKNNNDPKGVEEMKIDKSKLTDTERAFLDSLEKRYGSGDGAGTAVLPDTVPSTAQTQTQNGADGSADALAKALTALGMPAAASAPEQEEDIYKGLNPVVKAELEALKKFREEAEEKELAAVAKKYAIIGKKEEELVPVLKNLRAAGGSAYNDMIAILDQAVDTVEKSGAFSEIGKSGDGTLGAGAWAEAEAKAVELMKSKAGITKAQAIDEVLQTDPELAARCEKED